MKEITPNELSRRLVNMGYSEQLSAPLIANTYLEHKRTGKALPRTWEASTIADVKCCYNMEGRTEAQVIKEEGRY